jgi:hypothetical protein
MTNILTKRTRGFNAVRHIQENIDSFPPANYNKNKHIIRRGGQIMDGNFKIHTNPRDVLADIDEIPDGSEPRSRCRYYIEPYGLYGLNEDRRLSDLHPDTFNDPAFRKDNAARQKSVWFDCGTPAAEEIPVSELREIRPFGFGLTCFALGGITLLHIPMCLEGLYRNG